MGFRAPVRTGDHGFTLHQPLPLGSGARVQAVEGGFGGQPDGSRESPRGEGIETWGEKKLRIKIKSPYRVRLL